MIEGLRVLHNMNILHRDLKAANIFLNKEEPQHIMLGDLNVSKITKKNQMAYTQTGTPYYASPEIWKDCPYNHKSDIWSLGCVIYELCALKPPFRASNMEKLYRQIQRCQFDKIPSKYSDDLSTLISQCLQLNPNSRPNCDQLLKHPGILKRLEKYQFQLASLQKRSQYSSSSVNQINSNSLFNTIRIPKNLKLLQEKLPRPSYRLQSINPLSGADEMAVKRSPRSQSIDQCSSVSHRPASRNGSKDKRSILAPIKVEDENAKISPKIPNPNNAKPSADSNKPKPLRPLSPKKQVSGSNKENIPINYNNNYNNVPSVKHPGKAMQGTPNTAALNKEKAGGNYNPVRAIFYDVSSNNNPCNGASGINKIKINSARRMKSSDNRNSNNVSIFKQLNAEVKGVKNAIR